MSRWLEIWVLPDVRFFHEESDISVGNAGGFAKAGKKTAKATGLSIADAMRQSIRLGLPKLRAGLSVDQSKPLTKGECRQAFVESNPEFDTLEAHLANLPVPMPDEE